jgi:hypothetical protein
MKDIYMIICGFWGVNIENDKEDSFDSFNTTAVVGIHFDSYLFALDARIDNELRPRISFRKKYNDIP